MDMFMATYAIQKNEEWAELKRHFNIETVTLWMESSVSSDDWESMIF